MLSTARELLPSPGDRLAEEAAGVIRERSSLEPAVGVILGSGLGGVIDGLTDAETWAFRELPGFPQPTVPGHAGRFSLGRFDGVPVAAFQGRIHYYEGNELSRCALPVRLSRLLGARAMVITAAAGGVDRSIELGSIVVGTDQLNLMGGNVLRGWHNPDGTPPFVDLAEVYDREIAAFALERGRALGLKVSSGVYAAMSGPSYETPAEIEMLRRLGASAVGMSVVPETVAARALRMLVLGLWSVTNHAGEPATHEEVLAMADEAATGTSALMREVLPRLAERAGMGES
jgi:purine-nucleoside phosphorylase